MSVQTILKTSGPKQSWVRPLNSQTLSPLNNREPFVDAYLDATLTYIRANRGHLAPNSTTLSSSASGLASQAGPAGSSSKTVQAQSTSGTGGDGDSDEGETNEVIRISMQASGTHTKKLPVKTRRTTLAMALLRHFIKSATGSEMSEEEIRSKRIRLICDGEDVPYDTCCADMNDGDGLEDDECLDVVGL